MANERLAQRLTRGVRLDVRPAHRFLDDFVDQFQPQQIFRRNLERLGSPLPLARILSQDGRAALGRDHRVHRVFQHQHPVSHTQRQRSP